MVFKRLGFLVIGLILVSGGYVVGFEGVGDPEIEYQADGPDGPGYYEVYTTYPVAGAIGIITGLGLIARAVRGGGSTTTSAQPAVDEQPPPAQQNERSGGTRECPACGETIKSDGEFCTGCGAELRA